MLKRAAFSLGICLCLAGPVPASAADGTSYVSIVMNYIDELYDNQVCVGSGINFDCGIGQGSPINILLGKTTSDIDFGLDAGGIEALSEIALAVRQSDGHCGDPQVGHRADRVAGQDSEPPGVGRNPRFESDLHREVGDASRSIQGSLPR